jgi:dual specificity phosphatase 12
VLSIFQPIGRSATVVAAYLMKTLNIPPEEAVEMIREKRPVV